MLITEKMIAAAAKALTQAEATHDRKEPWINHAARYALTAALSDKQAVEVKALEWTKTALHDPYGLIIRVGQTRFGAYQILKGSQDRFSVNFGSAPLSGAMDNLDEALTWAQSDYEQHIRSALVDVPAVIPTANCCICGRIIDTREKSEGGDDHGDETAPGKWTCSIACYDAFTGYVPDVPAVEPVGEATTMVTNSGVVAGFTVAAFPADKVPAGTKLYTSPPLSREGEDSAEVERKFKLGDHLAKTKGSSWQGRVCGFYSTSLTPVGYCVESEREPGSVQIYPESAVAATRSDSATTSSGGDHG